MTGVQESKSGRIVGSKEDPRSQRVVLSRRMPRVIVIHDCVQPDSTDHAPQPISASEAHASHFSSRRKRGGHTNAWLGLNHGN